MLGTTNAGAPLTAARLLGGGAEFPGNGAYGGMQAGDIVGNLRLDQTWGSAQVMAAAHEVNAIYYASTAVRAVLRRRTQLPVRDIRAISGAMPSVQACG